MNPKHVAHHGNRKPRHEFRNSWALFRESDIKNAVTLFIISLSIPTRWRLFFISRISICSDVIAEAIGGLPLHFFLQLRTPLNHHGFSDIDRRSSSGNGVMKLSYELGSFRAKPRAENASVTSGHNVTCFDYQSMISPLFMWPNSMCHYREHSIRNAVAFLISFYPFQHIAGVFRLANMKLLLPHRSGLQGFSCTLFFKLADPFIHDGVTAADFHDSIGNSVISFDDTLSSLSSELWAEITSALSDHGVACSDYNAMIPLTQVVKLTIRQHSVIWIF